MPERKPRIDGTGRQPCTKCHRQSISGLVKGQGLCPYHWCVAAYGDAWANQIYLPEHPRCGARYDTRDEHYRCTRPEGHGGDHIDTRHPLEPSWKG